MIAVHSFTHRTVSGGMEYDCAELDTAKLHPAPSNGSLAFWACPKSD